MRSPVLSLALVVATGCGGSMAQLRTDNHRLAGDVSALRSELRAERRKTRDLENQLLLAADRLETAAIHGPVAVGGPPTLPIEVLSPDALTDDVPEDGALVGQSDDGSEIVYVGDAARPAIELDPSELSRRDRQPPSVASRPRPLRELPTSTALRDPAAAGASDQALELYRRGQAALKARDHAAAIDAFRALIARYPSHDYADNAQYWLGEAFYDQKDYARAITEFRATVSAYPLGNKVPDALVKIGLAYAALGEPAKARAALEQVIRQFPKTSPAAIAVSRLEQMP
ncbi:MAG: tol-pal system protein YbgF [Myxococcales bacterium]|nr:tol-pal system protein YbgF [Myxococcales bacterium]